MNWPDDDCGSGNEAYDDYADDIIVKSIGHESKSYAISFQFYLFIFSSSVIVLVFRYFDLLDIYTHSHTHTQTLSVRSLTMLIFIFLLFSFGSSLNRNQVIRDSKLIIINGKRKFTEMHSLMMVEQINSTECIDVDEFRSLLNVNHSIF